MSDNQYPVCVGCFAKCFLEKVMGGTSVTQKWTNQSLVPNAFSLLAHCLYVCCSNRTRAKASNAR